MANTKPKPGPTNCERCEFPLNGRALCPMCSCWNTPGAANLPADGTDGTVLLSSVTSAEANRLDVGMFNYVWSGFENRGIVVTSATLLGGPPGAGKTTLLLQMADLFAEKTELEVGFIAAEQIAEELRLYADRLQIKRMDKIRIVPAMTGAVNLGQILSKYKFGLVILDSLQGLVGEDDAASAEVCDICTRKAKELKTPFVLISQINKEGDYAGLMTLQHKVDTLMTISADEDGIRTMEVEKNRFGKAHIGSFFEMTEKGLVPYKPKDTDDPEDDDDDEGDDSDDE